MVRPRGRSVAARPRVSRVRRGDILLVSFDPTLGAEIRKTRPALVLQNDVANKHSPITIVAAITSKFDLPLYLTEVLVKAPEGGLSLDSVVLLNQVRSIDRQQLVRRLGRLKPDTMARVDRAIQISFGLVRI
ncbi:MAG: type II toxin-antitoxin system PemK/MazF family toxin [Acidobacteria bacterium]|nr:type II toxin-antitoxin system PemK/MazF family toxin [Acidobacteriota bacterium]